MHNELLTLVKRVQAIAEGGLHFTESDWDLDRYQDLEKIALKMTSILTSQPLETVEVLMVDRHGYRTPKTDVRSVVFNEKDEILMVKERVDDRWALPGGWADIGYTPAEVAEKETLEEAGIRVKAGKLISVMDKKCHDHPEDLFYSYKIFIECLAEDFNIAAGMETTDVGFFPEDSLPELSTPRNTPDQIKTMFEYRHGRIEWPGID